jgi:acetyltransferase
MASAAARSQSVEPDSGPHRDITIRPVAARDVDELERFYAALSDESRRSRFFASTRGLPHRDAVAFCTLDHEHREGFVAEITDVDGAPRLIGHLCLEPASDGTTEVAIAVADAYQGQGIGSRLMAAGVTWARVHGIPRLTATAFSTNVPLLSLLRRLGARVRIDFSAPQFASLSIDLNTPGPRPMVLAAVTDGTSGPVATARG